MEQTKLDRINELARISKERQLTPEEIKEQTILRQEYINLVHNNLRGQLNSMSIKYPDGSIKKVKPRS